LIESGILLGLDTCGAIGSIALARFQNGALELLGEKEIAGGALSVALVQGISDLLAEAGLTVQSLAGITAVAGPGSFTGIRLGLAAVKGLAEAANLPVVTLSRLALLADSAHAPCAVLDAHRGQFYCGMYGDGEAREMLLTAGEINAMGGLTGKVAVCEETVAQLLEELYGEPELIRVPSPTAAAALRSSLSKWRSGEFADVATLDGYYLRGADAKMSIGRS
jgi:tRNA threonylcarbamoyladenosine biosynthesis protein TsaB